MTSTQFSLSWEAYQKNMCYGLSLLQQKGEFVDMTIAADGHHVKVHQMVLSLVSPYIKELITSAPSPHPVIFLNRVSYQSLQSILEYAYTGEVLVARERIGEFLETCKALRIKGLENVENTVETTEAESTTHIEVNRPRSLKERSPSAIKRRKMDLPEIDHSLYDEEHLESDQYDDTADGFDDDEVMEPNIDTDMLPVKSEAVSSSLIQYSLSCQGSLQMVLNRYIYNMLHTRKDNQRMWRCVDYKSKIKCPAYVITRDDIVIERACAHTHPFHDKQILKRVNNGNIFSALKDAENNLPRMKQKILSSS